MNIRMEKEKDIWLYRTGVAMLGSTVVTSLVSTTPLSMLDQSTPDVIVASGSATSGGLAGLLTPSPLNK